jgi:hypothetical protein
MRRCLANEIEIHKRDHAIAKSHSLDRIAGLVLYEFSASVLVEKRRKIVAIAIQVTRPQARSD